MSEPPLPPHPPRPCSRCGRERDREGQRLCRACKNAYDRAWRRLQRQMADWRQNVLKGLKGPDLPRPIDAVQDTVSRETIDDAHQNAAVTVGKASTS